MNTATSTPLDPDDVDRRARLVGDIRCCPPDRLARYLDVLEGGPVVRLHVWSTADGQPFGIGPTADIAAEQAIASLARGFAETTHSDRGNTVAEAVAKALVDPVLVVIESADPKTLVAFADALHCNGLGAEAAATLGIVALPEAK